LSMCVVQMESMYKKTHASIREDPAAKKAPPKKEGKVKRYVCWWVMCMTFILSGVSRFTQFVGRIVSEQVDIGSVIMFCFSQLLNPCP